jgi:hypothetical protein
MDDLMQPMSQAELQAWILTDSAELRAVGTLIKMINESAEFFAAHPECAEKYSTYFESKNKEFNHG